MISCSDARPLVYFIGSATSIIMKRLSALLLLAIGGCASDTPRLQTVSPRDQPAPPCVFVDGEFKRSGRLPWTNGLTVIDAIQLAGGFTDFVSSRRLEVRHWDGSREQYRLTLDYQFTNSVLLRAGDHMINPRW